MFLGAPFEAARAASLGIINRAVPDDELVATVALAAETFCGHRRETLHLLKRTLRRSGIDPWPPLALAERTYLGELMAGEDSEEGLHAFLEKRAPVWKDG